jgi:transcriptional regulator with XRE-family HTH domain
MFSVGERIKEARLMRGFTQQELADKVGYKTKQAIAAIEAGRRDLSQSKVKRFAEALNIPIAYIMGWEEKEPDRDKSIVKYVDVNPRLMEYVRKIASLTAKKQEQIYSYIDFLDDKEGEKDDD